MLDVNETQRSHDNGLPTEKKTAMGIQLHSLPRGPFNLILIGILFVLVDFTINRFDLLNDYLGYILLAIGAGRLAAYSQGFATTKVLSFLLLALEVVKLILWGGPPVLVGANSAAISLVVCLLVWHMLGGIRELAYKAGRKDLVKLAEMRRLLFVIIFGGLSIITRIPAGNFYVPQAVGSAIAIAVLTILIIHLIMKTKSAVTVR